MYEAATLICFKSLFAMFSQPLRQTIHSLPDLPNHTPMPLVLLSDSLCETIQKILTTTFFPLVVDADAGAVCSLGISKLAIERR